MRHVRAPGSRYPMESVTPPRVERGAPPSQSGGLPLPHGVDASDATRANRTLASSLATTRLAIRPGSHGARTTSSRQSLGRSQRMYPIGFEPIVSRKPSGRLNRVRPGARDAMGRTRTAVVAPLQDAGFPGYPTIAVETGRFELPAPGLARAGSSRLSYVPGAYEMRENRLRWGANEHRGSP